MTDADDVTPSTTAEMVTLPGLMAVTNPVAPTTATALFELDQLTARSAKIEPEGSRTVDVSRAVSPTVSARVDGDTTIEPAVTSVTDTGADAANPSADA